MIGTIVRQCAKVDFYQGCCQRSASESVDGGVTIRKGSLIVFSRYSLHRHSGFWQEPEDFKPARFCPEHLENTRSTYASVPFGGGPRICIGIHFAMMELIVAVASIVQRFRVTIDSTDRHQMAARLTMHPKHGLKIRLRRATLEN
jgi:cytochrome P450